MNIKSQHQHEEQYQQLSAEIDYSLAAPPRLNPVSVTRASRARRPHLGFENTSKSKNRNRKPALAQAQGLSFKPIVFLKERGDQNLATNDGTTAEQGESINIPDRTNENANTKFATGAPNPQLQSAWATDFFAQQETCVKKASKWTTNTGVFQDDGNKNVHENAGASSNKNVISNTNPNPNPSTNSSNTISITDGDDEEKYWDTGYDPRQPTDYNVYTESLECGLESRDWWLYLQDLASDIGVSSQIGTDRDLVNGISDNDEKKVNVQYSNDVKTGATASPSYGQSHGPNNYNYSYNHESLQEQLPPPPSQETKIPKPEKKDFAKRILLRYGWTPGQGLGVQDRQGITKALRLKLNRNRSGGMGGRGRIIDKNKLNK